MEATSTYLANTLKKKQLATMIEKGANAVEEAKEKLATAAEQREAEQRQNTIALQDQSEALDGCKQAKIMVQDRVRDSNKAYLKLFT